MESWFTVKLKYTKQLDNGTLKRVTEPYLIAAMTFTDAEARIYEELGNAIRGEFMVSGIAERRFITYFQLTVQMFGTNVKWPMNVLMMKEEKTKRSISIF